MIGSLLIVVKATNLPDSQISFVTRAVRIIDILTGIDVAEFNSHDGMNAIVDRFVVFKLTYNLLKIKFKY